LFKNYQKRKAIEKIVKYIEINCYQFWFPEFIAFKIPDLKFIAHCLKKPPGNASVYYV